MMFPQIQNHINVDKTPAIKVKNIKEAPLLTLLKIVKFSPILESPSKNHTKAPKIKQVNTKEIYLKNTAFSGLCAGGLNICSISGSSPILSI